MFAFDPEVKIGTHTFETVRGDGTKLDLLDRAAFGKRLSELMERDSQPLVVALDGAWGSGKSHFLKLWVGTHNQDAAHKARVVYFDAFARDYLDDPLISLVAAISSTNEASKGKTTKAIDKLKAWGLKLARPAARIAVGVATSGLSEITLSVMDAIPDEALEEVKSGAQAAVDALWQREEGRIAAVEGFHNALAELAAEQPLILVIDELDRCRPDYALSLLEVVKHFFAVKGVRFVLGVNLEALEHSVRQRYGAGVDAGLYLQKFVRLKLVLPQRPNEQAWESYFTSLCARLAIRASTRDSTQKLLLMFKKRPVSLRDVERIAERIALLPADPANNHTGFQLALLTAIVLETLSNASYTRLRRSSIGAAEIDELFGFEAMAKNGDRFAEQMHSVWSRILLDEPSPDILRGTEHAFGLLFGDKPMIEPLLRDILDTFAPPPAR